MKEKKLKTSAIRFRMVATLLAGSADPGQRFSQADSIGSERRPSV
jgi:hypothetical protein